MESRRTTEFEAFVRQRRAALLRTATGLAAGDRNAAEDLVQTVLIRIYLAWPKARRTNIDAYARRALVNTFIDERRRPWFRREQVVVAVPERSHHDSSPGDDLHPDLAAALEGLPPSMRTAVVLRHVDDLSVEQVAEAMGCSTGNVKSQTARGLEKMRRHLAPLEAQPQTEGACR